MTTESQDLSLTSHPKDSAFYSKGPSILLFYMYVSVCAQSYVQPCKKYTSFDSYAYTDVRRMRFTPNCNTSPGLAGPVESSYEDYSVAKDTEEYVYKVRAVTKIRGLRM